MDLRDGRNNVPAGPAEQVFFDQNTPTTVGVVFDPNTPNTTDTLYVSSTNGSTWIYNGSAYVTYTAPAVQSTPFFITGTSIDAGSNKTAVIQRSGEIRVVNSTSSVFRTISGSRGISLTSLSSGVNSLKSDGATFEISTFALHDLILKTNNTERLRILSTGAIRFNSAYTFPTADGTANQVLKTNGAGVLTFGSTGLQYFTEAQNTTAPNATVPVDSLTAVTATTNGDIAIVPKGNGSFSLSIPDNTATGGNKRGRSSVDLQTTRGASVRVASGLYSVVSGGNDNTASGDNSVVSGGSGGIASGVYASVSGGVGCSSSGQASDSAGYGVIVTGLAAFGRGYTMNVGGTASYGIGISSTANADYSGVIGRQGHTFGIVARHVISSGQLNQVGDTQKSYLSLKNNTTDNTPTTLTVLTGAGSSTNQLVLQNNQTIRVKGTIIGRRASSMDTACWDIDVLISRGANAASTVTLIANINLVQNTPAWGTPIITANTSLGCLKVEVVGAVSTNIAWVAHIESYELIN